MDINKAMKICIDNGIKAYVIPSKEKIFKIGLYNEKEDKTKIFNTDSKGNKIVSDDKANEAVTKTYIYYAKKITSQGNK